MSPVPKIHHAPNQPKHNAFHFRNIYLLVMITFRKDLNLLQKMSNPVPLSFSQCNTQGGTTLSNKLLLIVILISDQQIPIPPSTVKSPDCASEIQAFLSNQ